MTLVWLLNQPPNDLPNALLTRWLGYIRLFDFTVRHVPGKKNGSPDGLLRHGASDLDLPDNEDPDDFFHAMLFSVTANSTDPTSEIWLDEENYQGFDLAIGKYLVSLVRRRDVR